MRFRSTPWLLAACTLIVSCSDETTTGAEPRTEAAGPGGSAIPLLTMRDEYSSIAKRIPGFAGLYLENGEVVVPVAGTFPTRGMATSALKDAFESRRLSNARLRFTKVRFSFQELRAAYEHSSSACHETA